MPAAQTAGIFIAARRGVGGFEPMTNLDFSKLDGLLPAVVQDAASGRVLMLGFMNEEAWRKTLESGNVTFYSRSRNKLWMKGESSGNVLRVKAISTDCDDDTLLIQVEAIGPGVCHNGFQSCFYRTLIDGVWAETEQPTYDPNAVYGATK
jgi:phosphoribosyl-AMP cyclohydrolase